MRVCLSVDPFFRVTLPRLFPAFLSAGIFLSKYAKNPLQTIDIRAYFFYNVFRRKVYFN